MNTSRTVGQPSLPGFDTVNRYWDRENQIITAKLLPGDCYVTSDDELITTVLGSCVSACIWDTVAGLGGMNHFMLPQTSQSGLDAKADGVVGSALRYGNYAMEHLINTILRHGGSRQHLEVKLFGGSKIIATLGDVGLRNVEFVMAYVQTEGLRLASYDLGDIYPRKINFYPKTGRVRMKKIKDLHNDTILLREKQYGSQLQTVPVEGSVELF